MILEVIGVAGLGVGIYEYFSNKSFKAEVTSLVQNAQAEAAALETKAASGVAVVSADVAKVTTAVMAVVAKL
jgi:hypothetical protein